MNDDVTMVVETDNGEERVIKLSFPVPDDVRTDYVNEVAIQTLHTEFILSFFEVRLPVTTENGASKDNVPTSLEARCVSRVALSVERIPAMISALSGHLKTFKDEREKLKETKDQGEIQDSNK